MGQHGSGGSLHLALLLCAIGARCAHAQPTAGEADVSAEAAAADQMALQILAAQKARARKLGSYTT